MVHRCLFIPNIKLIAVSAPLSQSGPALFRKIGVARKTCIICHLPTVITYKYSSRQWTELSQKSLLKYCSLHFTRKPHKSFTLFCCSFPGPLFKGLLRQRQILLSAKHCLYGAVYQPSSGSQSEIIQMKNMQIYILMSIFRARGGFTVKFLLNFNTHFCFPFKLQSKPIRLSRLITSTTTPLDNIKSVPKNCWYSQVWYEECEMCCLCLVWWPRPWEYCVPLMGTWTNMVRHQSHGGSWQPRQHLTRVLVGDLLLLSANL